MVTKARQSDPRALGMVTLLCVASLGVLGITLTHSFRDGIGGDWHTAWIVQGPRVLLALAAGAALGLAGSLRIARTAAHPLFEMRVLAVSTGAATAGWVSTLLVPTDAGPLVCLIAAPLGALGLDRIVVGLDRPHRWTNVVLALVLAWCAGLVAVTGTYVRERSDLVASIVAWLLGGMGHATMAGASILLVAASLLVALGCRAQAADRPKPWLEPVALALAFGAVGPLAFVGTFVPRSVRWLASGRSEPHLRLTAALCTGASVAAIDAVPRYLVGGYDFPWNLPAAMLALPIFLGWNRQRLRRIAAPASWAFEVFEVLVILGLTIGAGVAAATLTHIIHLAT